MTRRLKFVHTEKTRHGKTVIYFRRSRETARIRLPDDPNSPEFRDAYLLARDYGVSTLSRPRTAATLRKQEIEKALERSMRSAKNRSRGGRRKIDLDIEWLLRRAEEQEFKCALTSVPFFEPTESAYSRHPFSPSIDRIDCKGGYTKDNVRIVALAVNIMLSDWGESVFSRVVNCYRHNKNRTFYARTRAQTARTDLITNNYNALLVQNVDMEASEGIVKIEKTSCNQVGDKKVRAKRPY